MRPRPVSRRTLCAALLLTAPGCDFTPSLDINTPAHAPQTVLRAVLAAGEEASVRVSMSRDPYGVQPLNRPPSPTPVDAIVTVQRDGGPVEQLFVRPQTCYRDRVVACNTGTGLTEVSEEGPFECGAFGTTQTIEPGATYTLRADVPGLPPARAAVVVPRIAQVDAVEEASGNADIRRLRVRVHDVAGAGSRYALTIQREYDAFRATVCAPGGPRDTTIALGVPDAYETRFASADPVLLAGAREPGDALQFVTFTDETFDGGLHEFAVEVPVVDLASSFTPTGRLIVQLAVISDVLYDAFQITYFSLGDYNPFAEPVNLPTNVDGGLGRVGAVAITEVVLAGP